MRTYRRPHNSIKHPFRQYPAPTDIAPAMRCPTSATRRPTIPPTAILTGEGYVAYMGRSQYENPTPHRRRGTSPIHHRHVPKAQTESAPHEWDALHTLSITETGRGREVVTRIATRGTVLPPTPRYSRCRSNPCVERPLPDVPEPLLRIRNSCGCRPPGRQSLRNRPRRIRPTSGQTQSRSATPERQTKQPSAVH